MKARSNPWARRLLAASLVLCSLIALDACTAERPALDVPADSIPDAAAAPAPSPAAADTGAARGSPPTTATGADSGRSRGSPPDTATAAGWTVRNTRVTVAATGVATLQAVRTAAHGDYDRIVFEFDGEALPSYRLEYVDRPVRQCGSGDVVPLAGDAWLSIEFQPAQAHTEQGAATVAERSRTPRLPNLLELKLICDFEAVVEWVAGVASPEPYRVLALRSPTRLVVDIRH